MNWELVVAHREGAGENSTHRLKIPEGWLYRYGSQLVFVPNMVGADYVRQEPSWNHVANTYAKLDQ
jgi:hypothetical protein